MGRVLILLLAGCAVAPHPAAKPDAAAAQPDPELVKPWAVPGETMEMAASLRGLEVGTIVTAVGTVGYVDGRRAIIVRSRGQSTGMIALLAELTYEETATIDVDHGHAIRAREETWAKVAGGGKEHDDDSLGDEGAHDIHSAVAAVRAWRSLPGQHAHVAARIGGTTIETELVDAGHAYLASAHAPAVRYEGTFDGDNRFTVWVSDDLARVPLRFECDIEMFGRLVIELVRYTAPAD